MIIYSLVKISLSRQLAGDLSREQFLLATRISIQTKLTDVEINYPIIQDIKSFLSFEKERNLYTRNHEEYKRVIGSRTIGFFEKYFLDPLYSEEFKLARRQKNV
jgi:hypothetical protein